MDLVTIMDSVHGPIQLERFLFKIIDTQEFQRLRKIKQFGGVYYVYPGGVHTRFEHSIGVCYIAGQLVDALNKHIPESETGLKKWFTDEEKMCVQIAALCHDIGHGPFSHVYDIAVEEYFEGLKSNEEKKDFIKQNSEDVDDEDIKLPKEARHEYRSALIVRQLLKKLPFEKLNKDHVKLIEDMITFSEDYKDPEEAKKKLVSADGRIKKAYLYEIVANGFTGIDVDKMDYFARDSHSVGLPNSFDWRRFIQTAKIIKCDDGFHHICSRDKDALSLYELFHTRNVLYRLVYKHKTVVIVEDLIKEALKKTDIKIKLKNRCTYPLLQCWKSMDAFHQISDSVENLMIAEEVTHDSQQLPHGQQMQIMEVQEETDESPRKCYNKIWERKLPKFLGRTTSKDSIGEKDLIDAAKGKEGAQADKIKKKIKRIDVKFNYGMRDKNPILLHYFYGKIYPEDSFKLKKEEVSSILPDNFEEKEVFWYYKQSLDDAEDEQITTALWKCLNPSRLRKRKKSDTIDEECDDSSKKIPKGSTNE